MQNPLNGTGPAHGCARHFLFLAFVVACIGWVLPFFAWAISSTIAELIPSLSDEHVSPMGRVVVVLMVLGAGLLCAISRGLGDWLRRLFGLRGESESCVSAESECEDHK